MGNQDKLMEQELRMKCLMLALETENGTWGAIQKADKFYNYVTIGETVPEPHEDTQHKS